MNRLIEQLCVMDTVYRDLRLAAHPVEEGWPSAEYRWTRQAVPVSVGLFHYVPLRIRLSRRFGALHLYKETEENVPDAMSDYFVGVSSVEDIAAGQILGDDAILPLTVTKLYRQESRAFLDYVTICTRAHDHQQSFASFVSHDPEWNRQVKVLGLPVAPVEMPEPVRFRIEAALRKRNDLRVAGCDVLYTEPPVRGGK